MRDTRIRRSTSILSPVVAVALLSLVWAIAGQEITPYVGVVFAKDYGIERSLSTGSPGRRNWAGASP